MKFSAGAFLCLEGDLASSLYIVKSGTLSGTSSKSNPAKPKVFEPGSIIGVSSLLENAPWDYTIRALEDCEIDVVNRESLDQALEKSPAWLNSIISFLIKRNHVSEENKRKSDLVQALPSLLYVFAKLLKERSDNTISIARLVQEANLINGTQEEEVRRLLRKLQDLKALKIQGDCMQVQSKELIPLLYETLRFRALERKVSPNILSMTDQMILTVFVKLSQRSKDPLRNGLSAISTADLKAETKKTMHGVTLTTRTMAALVENKILEPSSTLDFHAPIDQVEFFFGDFDHIMDLLELNRIFPLLDKKLVE